LPGETALTTEGYTRESVVEAVRSGKSLEGEKLKGIDLSETDLRNAQLRGAQFRYSDLRRANLRGADLREANLRHVNLTQADLRDTDLRGADLTHADIRGALLTGARMAGITFGSTRGLSTKVFFPQTQLDTLLADGKADLQGEELVVAARAERWRLQPAARVLQVEAGDDVKKIVNKLLSESELKRMGLEVYRDTALVADSDTVYKLDPGMLGEPLHEIKMVPEQPSEIVLEPVTDAPLAAAPRREPTPEERKKSDQELINEFLLKRLTS
jgi:hypothetical protein